MTKTAKATENLKPVRSEEEARELGRKGGIASGEARRKKRDLRITLRALMDDVDDSGKTGTERLAAALFKKAVEGDVKAIDKVRDFVGSLDRDEASQEAREAAIARGEDPDAWDYGLL